MSQIFFRIVAFVVRRNMTLAHICQNALMFLFTGNRSCVVGNVHCIVFVYLNFNIIHAAYK